MKNIKAKYFGDKDFYKMILAIALPIVIQSLFTNFVAMLDNVMVGKVGTDQMTGVAVVNQLFFVFNLARNIVKPITAIAINTAQSPLMRS